MTKKATAKVKAPDKSEAKAKVDPIKLERVNKNVKHNFLDDELITFGYSLGQKYRAIRTVQAELKSVKADYTAREKSLEADIDEISGKLNAGFEMRGKDCFKFFGYKDGQVYWFLCEEIEIDLINKAYQLGVGVKGFPDAETFALEYLLTEAFEPVKQRPLRDHEKQKKLFDEQTAADGGGDPPGDEGATVPDPDPENDIDKKQTVETS
jgi:hypothetical protein